MHNINTKYWKKTLSNLSALEADGSLSIIALFMLGMIAGVLHVHLRWPLNIPGHHGIEWMTILLMGRMLSRYKWAALSIASGAAMSYLVQSSLLPLVHTVKPALIFLLNGACLDLLLLFTPAKLPLAIRGIILGGITYMAKPLLLVPVSILTGLHVGSFVKYDYFYPIMTHFMFGSFGAISGIYLADKIKSAQKPVE